MTRPVRDAPGRRSARRLRSPPPAMRCEARDRALWLRANPLLSAQIPPDVQEHSLTGTFRMTQLHPPVQCVIRKVPVNERSEEHTSELQSHLNIVCRLLLEKKKK